MRLSIIFIFTLITSNMCAQNITDKPAILYGSITSQQLQAEPFAKWFDTGYTAYKPNAATVKQLKAQNLKDISIKIFFGTWCGDSQREVPHFFKLLDEISFTKNAVLLIAVGKSDSLYKQSPQHEEQGLDIYKVPTFIIYKNGKEINRIIESSVTSLEKDLLSILTDNRYQPGYPSFALISNWMNDGTFEDVNITNSSLAKQLKPLVNNEHELNNLGYLFLAQGNKTTALRIFKINYRLYGESANVNSSLGEGYYENGDNENAIVYLENALRLNKKPEEVKGILEILYKAKGVK